MSKAGGEMGWEMLVLLASSALAEDGEDKMAQITMMLFQDTGKVIIVFASLFAIFLTRHVWGPPVYAMTCAHVHLPSPLDWKICGIDWFWCSIGWWTMNLCCSCICPPYHPPFRLRAIVHYAKSLRYTEGIVGRMTGKNVDAYVQIHVNHNPKKTTSVVQVPLKNDIFPVVWNEPIDLIINSSASKLHVTVWDQDFQTDDTVGEAVVLVEEFFKSKKSDCCWGCCSMGQEKYPYADSFHKINLHYNGKHAGSLWITFIIGDVSDAFPEFVRASDELTSLLTAPEDLEMNRGMEMTEM